jgi:hypothetical protein
MYNLRAVALTLSREYLFGNPYSTSRPVAYLKPESLAIATSVTSVGEAKRNHFLS